MASGREDDMYIRSEDWVDGRVIQRHGESRKRKTSSEDFSYYIHIVAIAGLDSPNALWNRP